ncbi:hypothetical protein GCK72_025185 [Caenorhabditis remanei]|uniref:CRE-HND-1 protein n=2 Tax=Caenorhabditis remanei TaxID=31234 RepID=E3MZ99_CAERE|nr:hypothetical protein GCK72_025185 [Caenorhabditis remanei]EFP12868.1 CRE-HND-1 protein [Caenorhabditis remanei]KAF1748718.1 hypothetical protein GCK72_025185 [Caenorhabditis remanei]
MTKIKEETVSNAIEARRVKKEKSREKEFHRSRNINSAFDTLQQRIPYLRAEERKNLPKIKTLRLAMQYINHLKKLVDGNEITETESNETRPLCHTDFRTTVTNEMRLRNSYRERAHKQEMDPVTVQRILAREENRRRCVPQLDERHGTHFQPARQFGPISNNVYNFRQMNMNQFHANYMTFQLPLMVPFHPSMENIQNQQVNYMMPMADHYMMENTYPSPQ